LFPGGGAPEGYQGDALLISSAFRRGRGPFIKNKRRSFSSSNLPVADGSSLEPGIFIEGTSWSASAILFKMFRGMFFVAVNNTGKIRHIIQVSRRQPHEHRLMGVSLP